MGSISEALELLFNIKLTGQGDLDKLIASFQGVKGATAAENDALSQLDKTVEKARKGLSGIADDNQKVSASFAELKSKIKAGLSDPLGTASSLLEGFGGKAAIVGVALGGTAAAIGYVAKQALDLVAQFGAAAEESVNLSDRLGISIGATERLQAEAKIAGVNIGTLASASKLLAAALEDGSGSGAKQQAALQKLGIETHTVSGAQRDMGAVLLEVLDRLSRVATTSERVRIAQEVLGRGSKELLPLIKNYDELRTAVEGLGVGLDENLTKNLAAADDELDKLHIAWNELRKSLAGKIAPIIIPVIASVTGAISGKSGGAAFGRNQALESVESLRAQDAANTLDLSAILAGRDTRGAVAGILMSEDLDRGAQMSSAYRGEYAGTKRGMEARVSQIKKRMAELDSSLLSGAMSAESFQIARKELAGLNYELERLQKLLARKPGQGDLRLSDLFAKDAEARGKQKHKPSLESPAEGMFGTFVAKEFGAQFDVTRGVNGEITGMGLATDAQADIDKARAAGILGRYRSDIDAAKEAARLDLEAKERLIELTTGPGGELAAAKKVYDLRMAYAQTELDQQKARLDYEVRIAQVQQDALRHYEDTAGKVFDALTTGGRGGLGSFLTGQVTALERQLFVNLSGSFFKTAGGFLGGLIPGQTNGDGSRSFIGNLLKGTVFDSANANTPVSKNTSAVERLTGSVDRLNSVIVSGGAGGGSAPVAGFGGLLPDGGASGGGIASRLPSWLGLFGSGAKSSYGALLGGLSPNFRILDSQGNAVDSLGARVGNLVGSAAIIGGGAFGILSGIHEGGARGATTAIGSALGLASAIPGPQQPFLQAAALVAGLVKGVLGDSKADFDKAQAEKLAADRYRAPAAVAKDFDLMSGGDLSYDYRGGLRVTKTINVTIPVQALDSKSFLDRSNDIAKAVRKALLDGGGDLTPALQQAVFS